MRTINTILAAALAFGMASCELNRENFNEIYLDNFYKSEMDLKLAVTALYQPFNCNYVDGIYYSAFAGYHVYSDMTTDVMRCTWGWDWDNMPLHTWYATSSGRDVRTLWTVFSHYNHISAARNVIRNIESCELSNELKQRYIAEAKALRAWMGLYQYDHFGPIPVAPDEVLDNPEQFVFLGRLSEEEYTRFMEEELLYAIEYLPATVDERGRMTKGAARMLLLKFYMIQRDFTKALSVARDLYKMEAEGVYTLLSDYASVFTKEQMGNKEIVLSVSANIDYLPNYWTAASIPDDYPWPAVKASNWGAFKVPWKFYDMYDLTDLRLQTMIVSYTNTAGKLVERGSGSLERGAIPMKYGVDPDQSGDRSGIDMVIYRFADVLLSLAECINETNNGPTQEAIGLVNRIRGRAGLGDLNAAQTANKTTFNEAILKERGIEFYCEGLRRQDLIRHGKFVSVSKENAGSQSANYKTRFPIPLSFIRESKDAIQQNPGY